MAEGVDAQEDWLNWDKEVAEDELAERGIDGIAGGRQDQDALPDYRPAYILPGTNTNPNAAPHGRGRSLTRDNPDYRRRSLNRRAEAGGKIQREEIKDSMRFVSVGAVAGDKDKIAETFKLIRENLEKLEKSKAAKTSGVRFADSSWPDIIEDRTISKSSSNRLLSKPQISFLLSNFARYFNDMPPVCFNSYTFSRIDQDVEDRVDHYRGHQAISNWMAFVSEYIGKAGNKILRDRAINKIARSRDPLSINFEVNGEKRTKTASWIKEGNVTVLCLTKPVRVYRTEHGTSTSPILVLLLSLKTIEETRVEEEYSKALKTYNEDLSELRGLGSRNASGYSSSDNRSIDSSDVTGSTSGMSVFSSHSGNSHLDDTGNELPEVEVVNFKDMLASDLHTVVELCGITMASDYSIAAYDLENKTMKQDYMTELSMTLSLEKGTPSIFKEMVTAASQRAVIDNEVLFHWEMAKILAEDNDDHGELTSSRVMAKVMRLSDEYYLVNFYETAYNNLLLRPDNPEPEEDHDAKSLTGLLDPHNSRLMQIIEGDTDELPLNDEDLAAAISHMLQEETDRDSDIGWADIIDESGVLGQDLGTYQDDLISEMPRRMDFMPSVRDNMIKKTVPSICAMHARYFNISEPCYASIMIYGIDYIKMEVTPKQALSSGTEDSTVKEFLEGCVYFSSYEKILDHLVEINSFVIQLNLLNEHSQGLLEQLLMLKTLTVENSYKSDKLNFIEYKIEECTTVKAYEVLNIISAWLVHEKESATRTFGDNWLMLPSMGSKNRKTAKKILKKITTTRGGRSSATSSMASSSNFEDADEEQYQNQGAKPKEKIMF